MSKLEQIYREASCSLSLRSLNNESTSSTKITDGCNSRAIAKRARTSFSPSPTYFDVRLAADIEKNVALHWVATARASNVFPFPGGPNNNNPLAGVRKPVNNSGLNEGKMTISCNACFAVCFIKENIKL